MVNRVENAAATIPSLSDVLNALRDGTRRQVLIRLVEGELRCLDFADLGSKTAMSYHFAALRKVGLIQGKKEGTCTRLSIHLQDVEKAFPGLVHAVLEGTIKESR
ncbi:MAG: helix-turn-helix domain-containing protein [Holophaga sp.]|nr:helix-turn-helix domain-containing protein [Holophaga sp.]